MPDTTPVTLLPGTLPYDCYPADPQTLNVDIITRAQAFLDEVFPGVYVGDTTPPANQRNRIWFNTLTQRLYQYVNGDWQRTYWPSASSKQEWFWNDTPGALETYDGGSAGAVGDSTGPLWEIVSEFEGRVPVGVGTLVGSSPAVAVARGDTGGGYQQTIAQANLPAVNLPLAVRTAQADNLDNDTTEVLINPAHTSFSPLTLNVPLGGSGTPLATMPGYLARYVIRRTARIYVSAPY